MRRILLLFILLPSFCFSQSIEMEEQSMSVCYMNDGKRSDVMAVNKVEAEVDGLTIKGYFDCMSPMSEACGEYKLEKYKPNSIVVNGNSILLGGQLNGDDVSRFNVGRFFYAEKDVHRFVVFEMADLYCPNMPNIYCYIIVCLNYDNSIDKHILYNKEANEATEEELGRVLKSIYPIVDNKEDQNALEEVDSLYL